MQSFSLRAKELLPSLLLTLISIIQALALEVLWSSITSREDLWAATETSVITWLQIAAVFQVIVLIWVYYAHLVMRLRWIPQLQDSIIPFAFGVGEFALAALLGPQSLHLWLYGLAAIFGFAQWATMSTFATARGDPENDWFFSAFPQSRLIQHGPGAVTVGVFLLLGGLVQSVGASGLLGFVAVGTANVVVVLQLLLQRIYWRRSLRLDIEAGKEDAA
jgi:hypothetical protein